MIIGIGSDLVDIRRIEKSLVRFGARFEQKIFTETEQAKAKSRANAGDKLIASTYAKRFAAKEACSKALGTGFRHGVYLKNIEVVNLPGGQPTLRLHGGAQKRLQEMMPAGMQPSIHLTMTDDYPLAQAFVIISAVNK